MSTFRLALVGALALLGAVSVHAQGTVDDLSCFLVRDQVPRGSVRAILNGLGGQSCRIKVPATFACIATQGTTVTPAPPASSQSGAFSSSVLCYRARCAPPRPPRTVVADAFGRRPVKFRGARWVCLPAAMGVSGGPTATTIPGSPVTTTTTPGTTATTTTLAGQPAGCHYADGMCTGSCGPGMRCGSAVGSLSCECRSVSCGQADAPACNGACADPSKTCVFNPFNGCQCVG